MGAAACCLQGGEGARRIHADHCATAHLVSQSESRSPGFLEAVKKRALARASVGTSSRIDYGSKASTCCRVGHAWIEVFKPAGLAAQARFPVREAKDRSAAYWTGVLIAQTKIQSQLVVDAPVVLKKSPVVVVGLKHSDAASQDLPDPDSPAA